MPRWYFSTSESSQTAPMEEHTALNDRYLLGTVIGEGGMDVTNATAAASRFLVEAKITGQLQHPGIPPVHELGTLSDGRLTCRRNHFC